MAFIQRVEAENPVVAGNMASVRVKATVSQDRNNKRPAESEEVVFFLGLDEKGREDTNDLGHAIFTIVNVPVTDKPQTFKLAACLPGDTTKKYSEVVTIPADGSKTAPKTVATKLRLDLDEGIVDPTPTHPEVKRYNVSIFALTEEDKPVPRTKITCCFEGVPQVFQTPSDAGDILIIPIDVHGFAHHSVFSAKLPNGKNVSVTLYGPRKPKPDPGALAARSDWKTALFHGLKGGHR